MKEMVSFLITATAAAMVTGDVLLPIAMPNMASASHSQVQELATGEQPPEEAAICMCMLLDGILPD